MLTVDVLHGRQNALVMVVVREIQGVPIFLPVVLGTFGSDCRLGLPGFPVPNGLGGTKIALQAFKLSRCVGLAQSQLTVIDFL